MFNFLFCCVQAQQNKIDSLYVYQIKGYAQGTTYSLKYYANKSFVSKESIDSLLNEIDNSLSIYKPESKISVFNQSKTKKVELDTHLKRVIKASLETYKATNGYFDITILPVVNLWGFGNQGPKNSPSQQDIDKAKSLVGIDNILIKDNYLVKRKKNVSIDVNGIAQGYTVDILSDYLTSKGIENFIIELGGEIVTKGSKPNGDFLVEIQRPYYQAGESVFRIALKNKAITTSGSYEKKKLVNGRYISHHMDPKTGYPIENHTLSVTVIANSALEADAIDNYLMFISPQEAVQFIENQTDNEVYIIYSENNFLKELQSSGFNNYIYR